MSPTSARLQARVTVITGAGGGIGRATAERFASEGATLALLDLESEALALAAAACEERGCRTISIVGDVRSLDALDHVVERCTTELGGIDVIVNNAGVLAPSPLGEMTEELWDRAHDINVKAAAMLVKRALPALRKSKVAAVVNVASLAAVVALPNMAAYCASKAALIGLTRALALDLHADGIRVNAVMPGVVDTPMPNAVIDNAPPSQREALRTDILARQIMKRMAHPAEIAAAIAFLASDDASFVTGAALPIDGGFSAW